MVWTFRSRSLLEKINRFVQAQKFYKTLPHKLDRAEAQWHKQQPDQSPVSKITEHEPDGSDAQRQLGGAIQINYKFSKDD